MSTTERLFRALWPSRNDELLMAIDRGSGVEKIIVIAKDVPLDDRTYRAAKP